MRIKYGLELDVARFINMGNRNLRLGQCGADAVAAWTRGGVGRRAQEHHPLLLLEGAMQPANRMGIGAFRHRCFAQGRAHIHIADPL